MCSHAGFRLGGKLGGGKAVAARKHAVAGGERGSVLCGLCCVFSLSISLLLLFPLFAVLLNCPYPDAPVSACFFPFSTAPQRGGGGVVAWCFCCYLQPNHNKRLKSVHTGKKKYTAGKFQPWQAFNCSELTMSLPSAKLLMTHSYLFKGALSVLHLCKYVMDFTAGK